MVIHIKIYSKKAVTFSFLLYKFLRHFLIYSSLPVSNMEYMSKSVKLPFVVWTETQLICHYILL